MLGMCIGPAGEIRHIIVNVPIMCQKSALGILAHYRDFASNVPPDKSGGYLLSLGTRFLMLAVWPWKITAQVSAS